MRQELIEKVQALVPETGRALLGICGAPASGKSTLAADLAAAVPGGKALPMDGFHLDDHILVPRGDRPRKGAPHTFDVGGLVALLRRARVEPHLYAPEFDRALEIARAGAIEITPDDRLLVLEGNWLLHDAGGWEAVRPLLDACWFLDVPEAELTARLRARWVHYGYDEAGIRAKLEENDLPNARLVAASKVRADMVLTAADID